MESFWIDGGNVLKKFQAAPLDLSSLRYSLFKFNAPACELPFQSSLLPLA